jgi:AccI restriction endonuclease
MGQERPVRVQVDEEALRHLLLLPISSGEKARIDFLLGNATTLPYGETASQIQSRYETEGIYSVMDAAGGRGSDFAQNQDQGLWAERLLRAHGGDVRFVYFGLSDPILPGDPAYDATRRKHRYMLLVEGKRPDLLVFEERVLLLHPEILEWSERPLTDADRIVLQEHALCGAEIKSSLQHYGKRQQHRRKNSGSDISVTIKEEEFADLDRWEVENRIPITIMQVFVDAIFIVSYKRFRSSETRSWVEAKTTKKTLFLPIEDHASRFADISAASPFLVDDKGGVTRPAVWPAASIENVKLPPFLELREQYRRKPDTV